MIKIAILSPFYPSTVVPDDLKKRYRLRTKHPYTWVTNLAEALAHDIGNDVHVVTLCTEFGGDFQCRTRGVTYNFLKPSNKYLRAVSLSKIDITRILSFVKQNEFDIVHGQGLNLYGFAAASLDIPNVVTIHLYYEKASEILKLYYNGTIASVYVGMLEIRYRRGILNKTKAFISISPFIRTELEKKAKTSIIFDIENAVAPIFFQAISGGVKESSYALFVGSLDERKSVLELLEAVGKSSELRLKIVSTTTCGKYFDRVIEAMRGSELKERVEFLGPRDNEELVEIIADSSFLVLPSKLEAAPMVISEAMAMGRPVIASNVNGIPYMVSNGKTGFTVDPSNTSELANRMAELFGDPELCFRMGVAAKQEACKRWHPEIIAQKTMAIYRYLLNS